MKRKYFNISIVVVYASTDHSTEEETETFLYTKQRQDCKSQEITVVMSGLNAKVAEQLDGEIVGKFELGTLNKR